MKRMEHRFNIGWLGTVFSLFLTCGLLLGQEADGEADGEGDGEGDQTEQTSRQERRILPANSLSAMFNPRDELVSIGGDNIRIGSDESTRNAVVIAGTIHVEGEITGDLVVVGGSADIDGYVGGNVFIVGGSANFGPRSEVRGDTVLLGGPFKVDPEALFRGQQTEVLLPWLLPAFTSLQTLLGSTLLLARPLAPGLSVTWWLVGGLFLVNLMVLLLLPRVAVCSVEALTRSPVTAFLVGLCIMLLFGPLLVLLVVSGFGILLLPFLLCLALATILLGKVAVYTSAGAKIVGSVGNRREVPLFAFFVGSVGFLIAYFIPVIGFMTVGLVIPLGIGAVILAGCNAFRGEVPPRSDAPKATVAMTDSNDDVRDSTKHSDAAFSESEMASLELGASDSEFERVGFWPRIVATLLDVLLVGLVFGLVVGDSGPGTTRLLFFSWFVYHLVMLVLGGATFGAYFMGLRCVTLDGGSLTWGTAAIRAFGSVLSFVALLIGFFWASWSQARQSWHDMIAGTTIVRVPRAGWLRRRARKEADPASPSFSSGDTRTVS